MKYLRPLILTDKYWRSIEREIIAALDELIYIPLFAVLRDNGLVLNNAASPLADAVARGLVWYVDGEFHGQYSAAITRELKRMGAVYHSVTSTWSLPKNEVPPEVRSAQAQADSRYDRMRQQLISTLDDVKPEIESLKRHDRLRNSYKKAVEWMDDDFHKTVRAITIAPEISQAMAERIADEWANNLNLYIKNWADDNILALRQQVESNAFAGRRSSAMVKMIQDNYGVGQRKAKFLARQETSLLMSKFRETRYADIGVRQYKWETSHDERVRPVKGANPVDGDHRVLQGKIFSFDDPPVTCQRTGARNNPGEDFNCRCIAIPLLS